MSLFPRTFYAGDPTFTNLFRMLDDFDTYSREVQGTNGNQGGGRHRGHRHQMFTPKFDVRETENTYELHGELPGVENKDINIEFTEPQTLVVSGRVERNYSSGTPPAGLVEGATMSGAITEGGEQQQQSKKASVADEQAEAAKEKGGEVEKKEEEKQQPAERYWYQERSVGSFSRTFTFPARVDESGVKASLNNGILNVTIPKAVKRESRRITVN